jgi:hypothetical protein
MITTTLSNAMNDRRSSSRADRFPWLLAAGPAIVVVASLVTFAIAATHDDAVVARNYYKLGLTINRTLAAAPAPIAPGEATVMIAAGGDVRVHLDGMSPSSLTIFVHAASEHAVVPVALHVEASGEWTGALGHVRPGRNIVTLVADGWRLPVTLVERLPATVRLRAEPLPS